MGGVLTYTYTLAKFIEFLGLTFGHILKVVSPFFAATINVVHSALESSTILLQMAEMLTTMSEPIACKSTSASLAEQWQQLNDKRIARALKIIW